MWFWIWLVTFLCLCYYWWSCRMWRGVAMLLEVVRRLDHGDVELDTRVVKEVYEELKRNGKI